MSKNLDKIKTLIEVRMDVDIDKVQIIGEDKSGMLHVKAFKGDKEIMVGIDQSTGFIYF